MNYNVVDVCPGSLGFDTIATLSTEQYIAMRALGFRFRWGYLGDLHSAEIAQAISAGVGILVIQHARAVGWTVTPAKGAEDGARAVRDAQMANLPKALPLYCDFEQPAIATTAADVLAYAQPWCAAVNSDGRPAKIYVGYGTPCSSEELWRLPFTGYAKSFDQFETPMKRGYELLQLFGSYPKGECFVREVFPSAPASVANLLIDIDVAQVDYLGQKPKMLIAA